VTARVGIAPEQVHLWLTLSDEIDDPRLLDRYRALLSPDEEARHLRLKFADHRRAFLIARALVRTTLSRYCDVAPAEWRFSANAHGRPEIDGPGTPLRFNLSHTEGAMVCAVALSGDVGVDIEDIEQHETTMQMADRYFAPHEAAALRSLPPLERRRQFVARWTLKEAYLKARGVGLALPMSIDPERDDDAAAWRFARPRLTPRHFCTIAVRGIAANELVVRQTVPLVGTSDAILACEFDPLPAA
jgi:4'-phosphopantetheinyl transferase